MFATFAALTITVITAQLTISAVNALIHLFSTQQQEFVAVWMKLMKLSMDLYVNAPLKLSYLITLASAAIFLIAYTANKMEYVRNVILDLSCRQMVVNVHVQPLS